MTKMTETQNARSVYDGFEFIPRAKLSRTPNNEYGARYVRDMLAHALYVLCVLRDPENDPEPDADEIAAMEQELSFAEWQIETLRDMYEDGCEDSDTTAYFEHM